MKSLLFLLFCAVSAAGQVGEITIQPTDESENLTGFIIYDREIMSFHQRHFDGVEGKKEIESIEINPGGDTLTIYRRWFFYTPPGGPGSTCLVFGCTSDHKTHFRDRLIFYIPGQPEIVRIGHVPGQPEEMETVYIGSQPPPQVVQSFSEQSGELKFVRREVGELKTVETKTKIKKWVYRK